MDEIRQILSEIAELLETGREESSVMVRDALCGSEETLERFLESNELWGGSGSIADQSLITDQERRKALEGLLIRLGTISDERGQDQPAHWNVGCSIRKLEKGRLAVKYPRQ
jgi:hypothetical protein